ncbi:GNAT family N-acetyltransferase [Photobacterium sp. 53610]|uniref:GNAT family N-acetyltransferase n=1 Tax=Photobacterium sp. 53610 TaxID=3102789 RepID=UPI002ED97633
MNISLLADVPEAAPTIAGWYLNEWLHLHPSATKSTITEKLLQGTNRTTVPLAFVAHFNGELAGAGELKFRELPDYPAYQYWLDGIYVVPQYRGKGISTQLIEFAVEKAKELGIPHLCLRCESHNVKLYELRHFKVIDREGSKFIMARVLDGSQ